jgi:polysaccharide chain length determinant protein (PEP-CTERM system associated)
MPIRPKMELREYGALFLRRKWAIVFSFLSILFAASVYFVLTPKLYKSSITILIIPQTVPEDYVRSTISFKVEQQLSTIKQQVMSRTTLTKMMDELALFEKERKKLSSEEMFALIRRRIEIEVVHGQSRGSSEAFSLSFLHEDPQSAMRATARLASLFIGENLKTREQQAVGTSEFLESQLRDTKARLEVMEQRVKDYKMRYMGELPQQMEANLRMLAGLQDRLRTNETSTRAAEERKVFLEAQISLIGKASVAAPAGEDGKARPSLDPVYSLANELAVMKAKLADLSARYTDRVPEVVRMRRDVEDLEKRLAAARQSASTLAAGDQGADSGTPAMASLAAIEEVRRMKAQLKAAAAEIASLKKEREEIRKGIASVEQKVERSPRREQEMISLIRDYENQRKSYDDLLKKKLEAEVSQNLEKRQKGTQFQILDPANLPEVPFQPDRGKVLGFSLLLALAVGFGGTIAWESLDQRLRSVRDFRHLYKVPILGYIPVYQDHNVQRARIVRRAVLYGGLITAATVCSILLLAYRDRIRIILNL